MAEFETVRYEEQAGVAWITLDRPEVHNAFNATMARELQTIWRSLRTNGDVNCAVLTAAGEKAFCTGSPPPAPSPTPPTARWASPARSCSTTRASTSGRRATTSGSR